MQGLVQSAEKVVCVRDQRGRLLKDLSILLTVRILILFHPRPESHTPWAGFVHRLKCNVEKERCLILSTEEHLVDLGREPIS